MNASLADCKAKAELNSDDKRINLVYNVDENFHDFLRLRLEDKIAEIIAVSYKYDYFKQNIRAAGLKSDEYEFLLAALIAADYDDDKRFIKNKLKKISIYTIDGFYNFRLGAIKNKWQEIAGYIPPYFNSEQLREFISFLIGDSAKSKKVYVDGGEVYDKFYNKLNRSRLIGNKLEQGRLIVELILSGCDQIELRSGVSEYDEKYLQSFFPGRVTFSKNSFS